MNNEHWHCMRCDNSVTKARAIGDMLCEECKETKERREVVVQLCKRSPEDSVAYFHTKYTEWQLEKQVLTEKLNIAMVTLNSISISHDTHPACVWAKETIQEIKAIEEKI